MQKKQIAEAAYEFLNDRDTIIIDDASTSFYLAQEIKNQPEKRIGLDAILVRTELPVPEETAAKPAGFFAKLRRWLKG